MITRDEIEELARYNAEVGRGIAHTPEYASRMADMQQRFDQRMVCLDVQIDRCAAQLEWLRRTAFPRWVWWLVLAVASFFGAVNVYQAVTGSQW